MSIIVNQIYMCVCVCVCVCVLLLLLLLMIMMMIMMFGSKFGEFEKQSCSTDFCHYSSVNSSLCMIV